MKFEWNEEKAAANLKIHGVSFEEAIEVFFDPNAVEGFDSKHSIRENRFYIIGFSSRRLLYVVYAEKLRDNVIRLI
ncbi:MAG TPA: BrnT family toxin, partial [Pyrinomonadaceae bacterium]